MTKKLDMYVIREVMTPFFMTLGVAALLLILERMLRLFDFVVNQGGPVGIVFRMLGTLIPHYLGLALPLGLFLGILLAFRKLALSCELDAMLASGTGLGKLVRPIFALCLFFMGINYILSGYIQPYAQYTYGNLEFDLRSGALGASVKVGEYVSLGDGMILRVEESRDNGANLVGIFLERTSASGRRITITAERGQFFSTANQQGVVLRLFDGRLVDLNEAAAQPRVMTFDSQDVAISLPVFEAFRPRGSEYLELTITELWHQMNDPTIDNATRNKYRGNFYMRMAQTVAFLLLPFLAIPLGITDHRAPNAVGIVVGLSLVIVMHEVMEVCEILIAQGTHSVTGTFGLLFLIYIAIAVWLFRLRAYTVGGDPLSGINYVWQRISYPIKKLIEARQ